MSRASPCRVTSWVHPQVPWKHVAHWHSTSLQALGVLALPACCYMLCTECLNKPPNLCSITSAFINSLARVPHFCLLCPPPTNSAGLPLHAWEV